jgi:hypothetical protein
MDRRELEQLGRLTREFLSWNPGEREFVITPQSAEIMVTAVIYVLQELPPERHLRVLIHLADNARRMRNELVAGAFGRGVVVSMPNGPHALLTENDGGKVKDAGSLQPGSY